MALADDKTFERLIASLGPDVPIDGVPAGLVARSIQKIQRDGAAYRQVLDRRGRRRLNDVLLISDGNEAEGADQVAARLSVGDRQFVLSALRRSWRAVEKQFGDRAWNLAVDLARRDVLMIRCAVADGLSLGSPRNWILTEGARQAASEQARAAEASRVAQDARRQAALKGLSDNAAALQTALPDVTIEALEALQAALESARGAARLPVLIAAAEDLLDGVRRTSPRDFSIVHFGNSKERDDVAILLAESGVPDEIALALGVTRSPRIGVGGAIDALSGDRTVALSLLDGPVLIRADQPNLRLVMTAADLVIVENLQAAEALEAGLKTTVAIGLVYTSGQPSGAARRHIAELCATADRVLLCPDADLGGVRIAAAILRELPPEVTERVTLCDAGAWDHHPQTRWPDDGASVAGLTRALDGPAAELASACLRRGYRVEQEENILAVVNAALGH